MTPPDDRPSDPRSTARPAPSSPVLVAADTGGTFTDLLLLREGRVRTLKVPSTPDDPARAVIEGLGRLLEGEPDFRLVHGSTVATNALLERKGARVALVTNRGFEDVLEIGRQDRPQLYALVGRRPPPLVPAADRIGIAGRLGPAGEEVEPLDPDELAALAARVEGFEGVAVCLLHAWAEPAHEDAVVDALAGTGVPVSLSSRVLPEHREYERTATTVVNAYVRPLMGRYLGALERDSGAAEVRVMDSGGGTLPVGRAREEAVRTVLSGPAGGAIGAAEWGRRTDHPRVLGFDMGGTSTDVSVYPGAPLHTREATVGGVPVGISVLDIHTVGAGGGSIARLDRAGALRVGPESAGAEPGPIAYGLGGTEITVTDANVRLGRLPADAFLGGERPLDTDRVRAPIEALARAMGTDPDAAAAGVLEVAETSMERALRVVSVERGFDPRDFALVAFGGAGGLHAAPLAARLGCPTVVVPPHPGLLSAWGMLTSPPAREAVRTLLRPGGRPVPDDAVEEALRSLEEETRRRLRAEGVPDEDVRVERGVEARYRGQSWDLRVPAEGWRDAFHRLHRERYGYDRPSAEVEAVTARVVSRGPPPDVSLEPPGRAEAPPPIRRVRVRGAEGPLDAALVRRDDLREGHRLEGPAVVTEYSSTVWLPPGWRLEVHRTAALLLSAD